MMSGTRMDATFNWSWANQKKSLTTLEKWAWIMPHDARISRDSLCHGKCMEGVGKTWEVARESADGDYCHFDYLTVEDEDDNDVDDDDDDWGLACVRSPLRFSQFFVKRRRLGFFNNAQPWRVDGIWWAEWSLVRISENQYSFFRIVNNSWIWGINTYTKEVLLLTDHQLSSTALGWIFLVQYSLFCWM